MPPIVLKSRFNAAELAHAQAELRQLGARARNVTGGLTVVGEALLKNQLQRFRDQVDPQGKAWAKLRPLTVMIRGGATGPILRRSGHLMQSSNYRVSGTTLRIGISGVQAGVQQFGATIVPKKASRLAIPIPAARGGRNAAGLLSRRKSRSRQGRWSGSGRKTKGRPDAPSRNGCALRRNEALQRRRRSAKNVSQPPSIDAIWRSRSLRVRWPSDLMCMKSRACTSRRRLRFTSGPAMIASSER